MAEHELPLEAATNDVIARYKRGNDMLASAAIALRRLKERVDAGEAGQEYNWQAYRIKYLQPHMSPSWISKQLALAPPGATPEQVAQNVADRREKDSSEKRNRRAHRRLDDVVQHTNNVQSLPPPDPTYDSLCRAWERASLAARRRFIREYGLHYGAA